MQDSRTKTPGGCARLLIAALLAASCGSSTNNDENVRSTDASPPPEETDPEPTIPPQTDPEPTIPPQTDPEPTIPPQTDPEPTSPPQTDPEPTSPPQTDPEPKNPPQGASWPTVFSSWTGGGDPFNTCEGFDLFSNEEDWPTGPIFGFGFDLGEPGSARLTVGFEYELCIVGFDLSRPVTLTVDDGSSTKAVTVSPGAAGDATLNDLLDPGGSTDVTFEVIDDYRNYLVSRFERLDTVSAEGSYLFTANQDDVSVSREVVVSAGDAGDPTGRTITADDFEEWNSASTGQTLTAVLIGFPPGSSIPLALFRGTENFIPFGSPGASEIGDGFEFEFVQELPPATVNEQGWLYYDLVVPDLAPVPGVIWDYCIATVESLRPLYCQPYIDAVFDLGS